MKIFYILEIDIVESIPFRQGYLVYADTEHTFITDGEN